MVKLYEGICEIVDFAIVKFSVFAFLFNCEIGNFVFELLSNCAVGDCTIDEWEVLGKVSSLLYSL